MYRIHLRTVCLYLYKVKYRRRLLRLLIKRSRESCPEGDVSKVSYVLECSQKDCFRIIVTINVNDHIYTIRRTYLNLTFFFRLKNFKTIKLLSNVYL